MTTRIAKKLFATAVTFIAVAPRMPFDHPWSVGGNLSSGFRKVLLLLTALCIVEKSVTLGLVPKLMVEALEAILEAFLGLLTPYLLRVWLSDRVNFPGRGKGLSKWIYAVAALCFTSVVGKATRGDDMWIFKKVGDAMTYLPTVATLRVYNTITSPGGQYPGRGSVLSQTILAAEYYAMLSHVVDITAKMLHITTLRVVLIKRVLVCRADALSGRHPRLTFSGFQNVEATFWKISATRCCSGVHDVWSNGIQRIRRDNG